MKHWMNVIKGNRLDRGEAAEGGGGTSPTSSVG